jgi:ABC-type Fe3+ transport system permease subunit
MILKIKTMKTFIWVSILLLPSMLFVIYPEIMLIQNSLTDSETGNITFKYFIKILTDYQVPVKNTIFISFLATIICLLIGIPLSFYLWKREFWGKKALTTMLIIPFMIPSYILVLSIIFIFGANGFINFSLRFLLNDPSFTLPIKIMFSYSGLVIAFAFQNLALVVFICSAVLSSIEPDYEEAAISLGATPFKAILRVVLPLALPGITGSGILIFARIMANYVIVILLGGTKYSTLAVEIVDQYFGFYALDMPAALSVFLSLLTMFVMYFYLFFYQRRFKH